MQNLFLPRDFECTKIKVKPFTWMQFHMFLAKTKLCECKGTRTLADTHHYRYHCRRHHHGLLAWVTTTTDGCLPVYTLFIWASVWFCIVSCFASKRRPLLDAAALLVAVIIDSIKYSVQGYNVSNFCTSTAHCEQYGRSISFTSTLVRVHIIDTSKC